jgi:hypothetical protein
MATAYTSLLGLALPVTGELSGSWGDTVNDSITSLLDSAISGTTTLSADADVTLTSSDGVADQARQAILLWTAGGTTTRNITAPAQSKAYFVINKTSSTQSIVIRGVGPTTGVTVRAGQQSLVVWNGVDFVEVASGDVDGPSSATDNAVARFDGTTGKLLQNSVVTIADSTGNMAGVGTLGVGAITTSGALTYGGVTLNNAVTGTGDMVLSTSPTLVTPALGTPSALVGTNITGTAAGLTAGNVTTNANLTGAITSTGNATLLGSFSSANLAGALTDETGTGSAVFANSPTLVTPALGTPASGVVTNLTGTASININGTVGATTASTGAFTTLTSSSDATLHGLTVGRGAGAVSTNTAVGASALAANTTGSNNVAVGQIALDVNTTGEANTAVGVNSLGANTSGSDNTATGVSALSFNTTGANNTALGRGALTLNTTASNNTAVGYQAAYNNTTGASNVAVGYQALLANTTANENVAIGRLAGSAVTTGSANTFIGDASGTLITTGAKNTIIGRYSGSTAPISATGSNFVVLSDGDGNIVASAKTAQTVALEGAVPNSGTGITFPATQSASSNANTLDDYEEGSWTPTLTSAGGDFTTLAYGDQQGTYTKVGRMVTVRGNLYTSGAITAGSASGQLYIAGLPYAASVSNLGQIWTSPDTVNYNSPLALATGVQVSASTLQLFKDGLVNNPAFAVTDLRVAGGPSNNFYFQATYFV